MADVPVIPHGHSLHAALHVVASQSPLTCPLVEYLVLKIDIDLAGRCTGKRCNALGVHCVDDDAALLRHTAIWRNVDNDIDGRAILGARFWGRAIPGAVHNDMS